MVVIRACGPGVMDKVEAVILRGCDFFDFSKIAALKTNSLRAKKSSIFKKVTNSERGRTPESKEPRAAEANNA